MPLPFDATLKGLLERSPEDWAHFTGAPEGEVEIIDADISTVTSASDKVLHIHASPESFLLDINFQRGPDATLPERLLSYSVLLSRRHSLRVRSVAILLSPRAVRSNLTGMYQVTLPGASEPYLSFGYTIIRLWELPVETVLESGVATLPLAPLCGINQEDLSAVIQRMKQKLDTIETSSDRQELWTATYILMGLRYDSTLIDTVLQGVMEMEESTTYQVIIAKGKITQAQEMLLRQGTDRFGEPSEEIKSKIESLADLNELDRLSIRLLHVSSWQEWFER